MMGIVTQQKINSRDHTRHKFIQVCGLEPLSIPFAGSLLCDNFRVLMDSGSSLFRRKDGPGGVGAPRGPKSAGHGVSMSDKPVLDSTPSSSFLLSAMLPVLRREMRRVLTHRKRAAKKGLPATLSFREWLVILEFYGWSCAFCKGPFESIEHVVPLRDGGGTTAVNCVPACLGCNAGRERMQQRELTVLRQVGELAQV